MRSNNNLVAYQSGFVCLLYIITISINGIVNSNTGSINVYKLFSILLPFIAFVALYTIYQFNRNLPPKDKSNSSKGDTLDSIRELRSSIDTEIAKFHSVLQSQMEVLKESNNKLQDDLEELSGILKRMDRRNNSQQLQLFLAGFIITIATVVFQFFFH